MKGNSVPFGEHLQRRRAALVSWLALAVAVGGIVSYALQADGYQAHRANLNDGGIWVTSKQDGSYGQAGERELAQVSFESLAESSNSLLTR